MKEGVLKFGYKRKSYYLNFNQVLFELIDFPSKFEYCLQSRKYKKKFYFRFLEKDQKEYQYHLYVLHHQLKTHSLSDQLDVSGLTHFWRYNVLKFAQMLQRAKIGDLLISVDSNLKSTLLNKKFHIGVLLRMQTFEVQVLCVCKGTPEREKLVDFFNHQNNSKIFFKPLLKEIEGEQMGQLQEFLQVLFNSSKKMSIMRVLDGVMSIIQGKPIPKK